MPVLVFCPFSHWLCVCVCVCVCVCARARCARILLGFELLVLALAIQLLYHLSHALSPFLLQLFFRAVAGLFAPAGLDHNPPTSGLPHSWDHKHAPQIPAYWLRWELTNFLLAGIQPPFSRSAFLVARNKVSNRPISRHLTLAIYFDIILWMLWGAADKET
jgi:hypothetical protein